MRSVRGRAYALIAMLVVVAFANGLGGAFVWDDQHLIVDNENIGDVSALGLAFTADYYTSTAARDRLGYYRPMVVLANHLDHALWGLNPVGFHVTNVLAHLAVCFLLFELVLLLSASGTAALIAAALFAVHPVHTESVTFISGRTDLLATLGFCAAWWLALRGISGERRVLVIAAPLAYLAGLLAKEIAVTLPAVLALCLALDRPPGVAHGQPAARLRRMAAVVIPSLGVLAGYLWMRSAALGHLVREGDPGFSPVARAATAAKLFGHHLFMASIPTPWLRLEPVVPAARGFTDGGALLGLGAGVVVLALAWWLRRAPLATLGLLVFAITLLPALNLVPLETRIAERFLYLPTVGLCMFGASLLGLLRARNRAFSIVLAIALVAVGTGFTIHRNHQWRDPDRLWRHVIANDPDHPVAWYNLGVELDRRGRSDEALAAYLYAIRVDPLEERSYFNIGVLMEKRGEPAEAERMYRQMLEIGRPRARSLNNLAALVGERGELAEAARLLEQATALEPGLADAWFNLALAYEALDRASDAVRAWRGFLQHAQPGLDADRARARIETIENELRK